MREGPATDCRAFAALEQRWNPGISTSAAPYAPMRVKCIQRCFLAARWSEVVSRAVVAKGVVGYLGVAPIREVEPDLAWCTVRAARKT